MEKKVHKPWHPALNSEFYNYALKTEFVAAFESWHNFKTNILYLQKQNKIFCANIMILTWMINVRILVRVSELKANTILFMMQFHTHINPLNILLPTNEDTNTVETL